MGHLLAVKDFCKLHIIFHYIAVLLRDLKVQIRIYPIGAVGDDQPANELIEMMKNAGMNLKFVRTMLDTPTLHSICFQFPDHSGGNITESKSASSLVSKDLIQEADTILGNMNSIVLSLPEVPLSSRIEMIDLGHKNQAFVAASFVNEEFDEVRKQGILKKINLLSVNLEEAAALGNVSLKKPVNEIVHGCIKMAKQFNPDIKLCITCGDQGIYGYEQGKLELIPVINVQVKNTAGAGDAVLSGIIVGLVLGFPFIGNEVRTCLRLGRLMGAMSVTSEDTINFNMDLIGLKRFQKIYGEEIV